jgi:hypothetical protein
MSIGQKERGGNGPRNHSGETKQKMSEKRKGKKSALGYKWTEEQKHKHSILIKTRKRCPITGRLAKENKIGLGD